MNEHERDLAGYGRSRPRYPWPNGSWLAVNFVINYEEGSEYSFGTDGRNEVQWGEAPARAASWKSRDLAMESLYEYGSRVGIWRLLDLFEGEEAPFTLFASARAVELNPEVGVAVQQSGMDTCGHGWRWIEPWGLSVDEEREHISRAVDSIEKTCGSPPGGWYWRHGPTENTRKLVVDHGGFLYDSDAYNDDSPYFVYVSTKEHLVIPYTLLYNDIQAMRGLSYFMDSCVRGFNELLEEATRQQSAKLMSIGLHARIAGQAARTTAVRELIRLFNSRPGVWIARRADIARAWRDMHNVAAVKGRSDAELTPGGGAQKNDAR